MAIMSVASKNLDAVKKKVSQVTCGAALASAAMTVMPMMCADVDINAVMGSVLGIIFQIGQYLGIVLSVWAVFSLVLSFKNEDSDSKARSTQLLCVGLALVGLKGLASVLLGQLGITVTMPT